MIEKRRLGQSDIEITPIGLGCQQFAVTGLVGRSWDTPDEDATNAIVKASLPGGVNWFDTAEMYGYGQSERALTSALRGAGVEPGGVVVATKWYPQGRRASNMSRTIDNRLNFRALDTARPLIDELSKIADAYGVSRAQVALNWVTHFYGDTVVAIPGASKPRQAQESADALAFRLTDKELARLDELSRPAAR
jgi:aryl-alcohol dehydrogenase-like predicted oxidoreductase